LDGLPRCEAAGHVDVECARWCEVVPRMVSNGINYKYIQNWILQKLTARLPAVFLDAITALSVSTNLQCIAADGRCVQDLESVRQRAQDRKMVATSLGLRAFAGIRISGALPETASPMRLRRI